MTLKAFKELWEADGTRLIQHERKRLNDSDWYLYSVEFPQATNEYGRHMAMILKVDPKTEDILMHDLKNQRGAANWTQEIDDWFKQHVGRY